MRSACLDEYQHAVVWYDDLFLFGRKGRVLVLAQGFLDLLLDFEQGGFQRGGLCGNFGEVGNMGGAAVRGYKFQLSPFSDVLHRHFYYLAPFISFSSHLREKGHLPVTFFNSLKYRQWLYFFLVFLCEDSGQYRIILSADTSSEVRQMLSQKRR